MTARDRLARTPNMSLADLSGDALCAWSEMLIAWDLAGKTWRAVKARRAEWIGAYRPEPVQLELGL